MRKARKKNLKECNLVVFYLASVPTATAPHSGSPTENEVTKSGGEPVKFRETGTSMDTGDRGESVSPPYPAEPPTPGEEPCPSSLKTQRQTHAPPSTTRVFYTSRNAPSAQSTTADRILLPQKILDAKGYSKRSKHLRPAQIVRAAAEAW